MKMPRRILKIILCITVALSLKASYGMVPFTSARNQNGSLAYNPFGLMLAVLDHYYPGATLRELASILEVLNHITDGAVPAAKRDDRRNCQGILRIFCKNFATIEPYLPFVTLRDANDKPITACRRALETIMYPRYSAKSNETFEIPHPE